MRVLYLTKDIENYRAANYQKEFLKAFSKIALVYTYGPGYKNFDIKKNINNIINLYGPFDCIFIGHYWLHDGNQNEIDPWPKSGLSTNMHKKFIFLNKEYANLDKKLKWIKENKFDCVFSHYQECHIWKKIIKTQIKYLPFAYDHDFFNFSKKKRKYDLAFSGVLQNSRGKSVQSDIRIRILNCLFYTFFDIPIFKKKKYRDLSIFWNTIPANFIGRILSRIFGKYKFLDKKKYSNIQKNTKIYLNCKSPLNLISPRYFENIASGCLIITEKNTALKRLIPQISYKEFNNDLRNFDRILRDSLKCFKTLDKQRKNASSIIKKNHSWNVRASKVLKIIKTFTK